MGKPELNIDYICTVCGSNDIFVKVWYNYKTGDVDDSLEDSDRQCYCNNCDEHTTYRTQSHIKNNIKDLEN